jgi:hypothetical protein
MFPNLVVNINKYKDQAHKCLLLFNKERLCLLEGSGVRNYDQPECLV